MGSTRRRRPRSERLASDAPWVRKSTTFISGTQPYAGFDATLKKVLPDGARGAQRAELGGVVVEHAPQHVVGVLPGRRHRAHATRRLHVGARDEPEFPAAP